MPLEACMLVIDNSEYMRNGDYPPNRFDAQTDAITTVFSHKVDSNPENTAGVMTMAGKSPEVLVTPTQDVGKILSALHNTKISGSADIVTAIQVAQLALKHRQNKNLRQRIIAFIGSPLSETIDEKTLVKVGKKLKKNNVALDIVSYGEYEMNEGRLRALVEAVQSNENSHFLIIASGSALMSDILLTSPILRDPSEAGPGGAEDGGNAFEFGFDPSLDPELAMVLRMSAEEEAARQRAAGGAETSAEGATAAASSSAATGNTDQQATPRAATSKLEVSMEADDDEDDTSLAQALAMSNAKEGDVEMEGDDEEDGEEEDGEGEDDEEGEGDEDEDEDGDEDDDIARAIEMSMNPGNPPPKDPKESKGK